MSREERERLRYLPSSEIWQIVLDHPMVGFQYQLRWRTPGAQPDGPMPGQTLEWRRLLLQMGKRVGSGNPTKADQEAQRSFDTLRDTLDKLLGEGGANEKRTTALFVYDRDRLALIPVLSHQSWSTLPLLSDFAIPLGDGIAGAAFQQRRTIMWAAETPEISPFIHPVPYPDESAEGNASLVAHVAVPVYHASVQEEARPSPWSVIGVVSFGSSSLASHIPAMCDLKPNKLSQERIVNARRFAQTHVQAILDSIRGA